MIYITFHSKSSRPLPTKWEMILKKRIMEEWV
jgi:hypothetical protein